MTSTSLLLSLSPHSGLPIYQQLVEQIERLIQSGQLAAGTFLPSVRQLASELTVNPMTISKAYSLLEDRGVVVRERGKGMRVVDAPSPASIDQRLQQLMPLMDQLKAQQQQLNIDDQQLLAWITEQIKGEPQ